MTDRERTCTLEEVTALGFALDDALLYLDVNSCDKQALAYYQEKQEAYRRARHAFVRRFGPLQMDEIAPGDTHLWTATPWPWETEE